MSKREKGNRRERQCKEIYEEAGYRVEKVNPLKYGRSDWFGLFDLMCFKDGGLVFVQVRSNQAGTPREWFREAKKLVGDGVGLHLQVCYDRQGWRLLGRSQVEGGYEVLVDEREFDRNMGDVMVECLAI